MTPKQLIWEYVTEWGTTLKRNFCRTQTIMSVNAKAKMSVAFSCQPAGGENVTDKRREKSP